jgi:hypothetical protein
VAPVVASGASLPVVRVSLLVVSTAALIAAFWVWLPVTGRATALGAFLFGSSWVALLYGSEVMPNLWSAIIGVAAVGWMSRSFSATPSRRDDIAVVVLLAALGLFRPPDTVPIVVAYAVVLIGTDRFVRRLLPAAIGLVLGWLPWLIEMSIRFEGPVDALRRAAEFAHVSSRGIGERVLQHLALTNGPTLDSSSRAGIALGVVLWWVGLLVVTAVGLRRARGTRMVRPLLLAAVAGLGLALEYLLFVAGTAPRFLLPVYALLSIPAAFGIWQVVANLRRTVRVALVAGLVVPWLVWQLGTADRVEAETDAGRQSLEALGVALRAHAGSDRACAFVGIDGYPQIEYASGCIGSPFVDDDQLFSRLSLLVDHGYRTYVVVRTGSLGLVNLVGVRSVFARVVFTRPAPQETRWLVYEISSKRFTPEHAASGT